MRLLLDTHALLWWHSNDARLADSAKDIIRDPRSAVLVSLASLWEVAIKSRIGKLDADVAAIATASEADGFDWLQISVRHLEELARLPTHHRDPFDQLLIAQAIAEKLVFVTADRRAALYPVAILPCSEAG